MKQPTGRLEGNDLVLTRKFEAPIEDVWTSITKSESTARWYGSWTGTPGAGNCSAAIAESKNCGVYCMGR